MYLKYFILEFPCCFFSEIAQVYPHSAAGYLHSYCQDFDIVQYCTIPLGYNLRLLLFFFVNPKTSPEFSLDDLQETPVVNAKEISS